MLRLLVSALILGAGFGVAGMLGGSSSSMHAQENSSEDKPFGIERRIPWTTSRVQGFPEPPPPYKVRRAFPNLTFNHPVYLIAEPPADSKRDERLLVVELAGKVLAFANDSETKTGEPFLNLPEHDTYGMTFHPRYAKNGLVYIFSNGPRPDAKADKKAPKPERHNRIYAFQVSKEKPYACDLASKKLIIEWPSNGHNGGDLAFGPDGHLYISSGDGTSDSDGWLTGQNLSDLNSGIIRIDVDRPDPDKGYSVPKDNPFRKLPDARPELWAFGLRNPWRMCFEKGRLWVGDVGQDLWEMVHLIRRGGNYGWSVHEGSQPFHLERKRGPGPFLNPVVAHHHAEARSITMGQVYQGRRFKDLRGAIIYGDYSTGKIWGLRYEKNQVTWNKEIAASVLQMVGFGRDRAGEMYIVDHTGPLYELEANPQPAPAAPFPRTLSETGLFTSVKDHQLVPGIIPYSVNASFWTDHSYKDRFIALPGESTIEFRETGAWQFPEGAVLVKTFNLDLEHGNPKSRQRIETRLLTFQQGQWYGYSYRWNEDETEAHLVPAAGADRPFAVKDASYPDGIRPQTWHYPSRSECMVCHSRAAGFVLGLNTLQMNKVHDYGMVSDNQLRTMAHLGLFRPKASKGRGNGITKPLADYPRLPDPYDAKEDLTARARAYLHVNCANCHVDAGGGNSAMDLHWRSTPEKMRTIDAQPLHDRFGITEARLIAPGDPQRSLVHQRLTKSGRGRMPPLSSTIVDEPGAELLAAWIRSLGK